jgi:signal transduction histidine kinase
VVQGDHRRLEQVLVNLLDNAVKYSPAGGAIRIMLSRRGADHEISVADEGIGIPSAELCHVTRPYFRASNAPLRNYPGLGLGLSIAREIVERHGGRLWFESRTGAGTTAHVLLPAFQGEPDAPEQWVDPPS